MIDYRRALFSIPCDKIDYDEWNKVMMAAKDAIESGEMLTEADVDEWNQTDPVRYQERVTRNKFDSYNRTEGARVTKASLVYVANKHGFDGESDPVTDLLAYLKAVFNDSDIVAFNINSDKTGDKYRPAGLGTYEMSSEQIQKRLKVHGTIEEALGDYNHDAGGWIRINPMDGGGVYDKNVSDYRNVLIECDNIPQEQQLEIINYLKLPTRALVDSGGKSIHAIMKVDAKDKKEFEERVNFIFSTLPKFGLTLDTNDRNESRLSRMPGLQRGKRRQRLISINDGIETYEEWVDYVKSLDLHFVRYSDVMNDLPPLAPELIKSVLRRGHKLIITAPPKAGKTQLLIELAIALTEGRRWLGHQCEKCKVLYVNLEVDEPSMYHRVDNTYKALGITPEGAGDLVFLNLKGKAEPIKKLGKKIITQAKHRDFDAIILDPIYKIQDGDENSAKDITAFTNELDRIARELGVSVIYSHHHSKGAQAGKNAMDRAAGSGAFARDADAILDFLELESDTDDRAYCITPTYREFGDNLFLNVYFHFPIHVVDTAGNLDDAEPKQPGKSKKKKEPKESIQKRINDAFSILKNDKNEVKMNELLKYFNNKYAEDSMRNNLSKCNGDEQFEYRFTVKNGVVTRQKK